MFLAAAISALILVSAIIHFHSGEAATLQKWQGLLMIVPSFVIFSVILALWYASWFAGKKPGAVVTLLKIFYWLVFSVFCFIGISTVQRFVF